MVSVPSSTEHPRSHYEAAPIISIFSRSDAQQLQEIEGTGLLLSGGFVSSTEDSVPQAREIMGKIRRCENPYKVVGINDGEPSNREVFHQCGCGVDTFRAADSDDWRGHERADGNSGYISVTRNLTHDI